MPNEFESVFSDLAYAFLRQTNIDISKHMIGFEIVDHNDAKTRGLGMFAIKVGKKYYYVPVFFNNGEVKPLIQMYDKQSDMFLPLNNEWIEFLEKSTAPVIGDSVPAMEPEKARVNLRRYLQPPFVGKTASVNAIKWAEDIFGDPGNHIERSDEAEQEYFEKESAEVKEYFKQCADIYEGIIKCSSEQLSLPGFLAESSPLVKHSFLRLLRDNKGFLREVCNTYTFDVIKEACAIEVIERRPEDKVRIIDDLANASHLSNEDKVKFMKNGYFIEDSREELEKVAVHEFDLASKHSSPSETGVYELVTDAGKVDTLVVVNPYDLQLNRRNAGAIVVDLGSKNFTKLPINELITYHKVNSPHDDVKDLSLVDISKMKVNSTYILIDPTAERDKGYTSEPVTIRTKSKNKDGVLYYGADQNNYDEVNICVKEAGNVTRLGRDVAVPKHFKALEVKSDTLRVFGRPEILENIESEYDRMKVSPANAIHKNAEFVEKYSSVRNLQYSLVKTHGLSVNDAERCTDGNTNIFWVKKANIMPVQGLSGIPENVGRNYFDGNAPGGMQEVEYDIYSGENLNPRSELINTYENIQNEVNKATALSENGMKDVFDKATMGSMTRLTDVTSEMRSYIPDLMTGMDKLARILFVFWHKPDKIKDKFSLNEFSETEDIIKDTFKNLGDIVLDLKKKYMDYE